MNPREVLLSENYEEHEVATALGITVEALRVYRCRGKNHPPFIKIGRKTFYPKKEYHAWVKKRKITHPIAG